jgi:hypothetical protein
MAIVTTTFGTVAVAVQQNYRMSADDPQIQMTQDAATSIAIARQEVVAERARYPRVDVARSLAPWLAVYDRRSNLLEGSATLDGTGLLPPAGVFQSARTSLDDRVTWQPRPGVRAAIVVRQTADGGFVVAGRSLREVEKREDDLTRLLLVGWLAAIGISIAAALLR